jgi:class 3 adenylate cyclase
MTRRDGYAQVVPRARDWSTLEREIEAINRFPGQNPNPVLRISEDGTLTYANDSAAPITEAWRGTIGERLRPDIVRALREAAAAKPPQSIEVGHGRQTFAVLAVHVPDLGVYNLYGTDITAAKVIEHFPGSNPNPVLRMAPSGVLRYANGASRPITEALGLTVDESLPLELLARIRAHLGDPAAPAPEVPGEGGRTYRLTPVLIGELDVVNLYGTDITAEKAIDKFPNQNPNPVLRLTRSGRMTYANPASVLVRKALGAEVGDALEPSLFARIVAACESGTDPTMEVEADQTIYRLRVVSVYEFDSINLYGTDITAARMVERLNAENEALVLNILPRSIAERLRGGETVIADRFDDMAVLFADVVGFTELSSRLTPKEVVSLLNDVFTMCDHLAEQFGLEKIKTVGDAYMVVGGLQLGEGARDGTHAEDVADMGLAMLDEVDRLGKARGMPMQIRVGMHVGPAVAGVIGIKKFIYDVWGDTVNTASRMESTGVPGRFQVTPETEARLRDRFEFEPRGPIQVKGKGLINTWFVVGRRANQAPRAVR